MSVKTDKLWLIDQIMHLQDAKLIGVLKGIIELNVEKTNKNDDHDFWNELTSKQKESIEISIRQLKNDEGIPHEKVMAEFRQKYTP